MSSVAVKIGDDVLEVHGESSAMINGIEFPVQEVAGTEYPFPMKIGGYDLSVQIFGPHSRRFIIHMGDGEKIQVSNFKYIVNVELKNPRSADFEGSVGIWGSYSQHGAMLARDGKTHLDGEDAFGQEWQGKDSDPAKARKDADTESHNHAENQIPKNDRLQDQTCSIPKCR